MLIYDGDCEFCTQWVRRIRSAIPNDIEVTPYQSTYRNHPQIPLETFRRSVQWVSPGGRVRSGAEAALTFLSMAGLTGRLGLWCYGRLPGFSILAESAYRLVAGHRSLISTLVRWLWGSSLDRPAYGISANLFLRLLGAVYLIAFASLVLQVEGLMGPNGILPAERLLDRVSSHYGWRGIWYYPTFFWFDASGTALITVCGFGAGLAMLGMFRPASWPLWLLLYFGYLSLVSVGDVFLSYQWDALLLETGILALFLVPVRSLNPGSRVPAPGRLTA